MRYTDKFLKSITTCEVFHNLAQIYPASLTSLPSQSKPEPQPPGAFYSLKNKAYTLIFHALKVTSQNSLIPFFSLQKPTHSLGPNSNANAFLKLWPLHVKLKYSHIFKLYQILSFLPPKIMSCQLIIRTYHVY